MSSQDTIRVQGTIVERLPNTLYRVQLPNNHRLLAFVPKRLRLAQALQAGTAVTLEISPFDFSVGRLTETQSP